MQADNNYLNSKDDEFLELKNIYNFFIRNKTLIFKFSIIGLISSGFYAYLTPKTWQGEFQIVMQQNDNLQSNLMNYVSDSAASNFIGLGKGPNVIDTQVEILKSPSILIKIFDYVKSEKSKNNKSIKLNYNDWKKKQIEIKRTKKTSVLNLKYKDKDKLLILPTLRKISSSYQKFSSKDRQRANELTYTYLKKQKNLYKQKSQESINKLYNFGTKNNLNIESINLKDPDGTVSKVTIDVESKILNAKNRIKFLEERIDDAKLLDINSDQILYFGDQIKELQKINNDALIIKRNLQRAQEIYKDGDESIKRLKLESKIIKSLMKDQIINNLISKRDLEKSKVRTAYRPEEVLNEFRNLYNQSKVDKNVYDLVTRQFQIASLEKERIIDPWEVITEPTLFPGPVAPKKLFIIFTGTLSITLIGILTSIIKERRKS